MNASVINCISCGAPVDSSGTQRILTCSYCGCELHFSPGPAINIKELAPRVNPKELSAELAFLNHAVDVRDNQAILKYAYQLIKKDASLWAGYFYAAYGLYWHNSANIRNQKTYFDNLNEITSNLELARNLADNLTPIIQLERDLIFNLCSVANRQGKSDFTGSNIIQSFELFSFAKKIDATSEHLTQTLKKYAVRLTNWSIGRLEEESRDAFSTPSASYLEYIYYCWKNFDVNLGMKHFEKYSKLFINKSSNSELVLTIKNMRSEMVGVDSKPEKRKGFLGFFWLIANKFKRLIWP